MPTLPSITEVMQRAQALAALDLIMSPEWDSRYYSFNTKWSNSERMASMRNGCGDEWWIVHHASGWAALKGLAHESEAWSEGASEISEQLQSIIPEGYGNFSTEPAFVWDATSFAYVYRKDSQSWLRANDQTDSASLDAGDEELLEPLVAPPEWYVAFAASYYEAEIPLDLVSHIYAHMPITEEIVRTLNPDVSLSDIAAELFDEIDYPR